MVFEITNRFFKLNSAEVVGFARDFTFLTAMGRDDLTEQLRDFRCTAAVERIGRRGSQVFKFGYVTVVTCS